MLLRHSAPRFLQRANGRNLVNAAVDAVRDEFGVIALTSPRHYPRNNGVIERGQQELKAELKGLAGWPLAWAAAWARLRLNGRPRRCLHGRSARTVFLREHRAFQQVYTLQRRREVKDWIRKRTMTILATMQTGSRRAHDAAWRQVVERWLLEHGFLEVLQRKSVTRFR